MTSRTIYLIRHGTTEWIERGFVHGSLDSPLSKFGEWEAQQTAAALVDKQITHIYTSPQGRAAQTASAIAKKFPSVPITPLEGLREMGFGKMEGKRDVFKKLKRNPLALIFIGPVWLTLLGFTGENKATLRARVAKAWQQILSDHSTGNIAVVSHAITLNTILSTLPSAEGVEKKKRYNLGTCSISRVVLDENSHALITVINDTSHLDKGTAHDH
ncbi:MAG: histidine phosphatase family protein [Anaerolineaceae bacterium]|jgi:broad specificity phosphatase PhoE|nr:MAG: histidine phosphatase family protein [Anaerolineaceae bacterium]